MMLALLLSLAPATFPAEEALLRLETAPPAGTSGEPLFRKAQELRYGQRWFESAAAYRAFLAAHDKSPRVAAAQFYLASVLERDQRWDEAANAYTLFLEQHPEQRSLGKEARLGRIRCWGIRQHDVPTATPGLAASLQDQELEIRVLAALELARIQDRRAVAALSEGLGSEAFADRCTMALLSLGEKPPAVPAARDQPRFLVVRIQEEGKKQPVEIRLSTVFVKALTNYLSDAQLRQARAKGVDLEQLGGQIQNLPKGSVLFSVSDPESQVTVTVE